MTYSFPLTSIEILKESICLQKSNLKLPVSEEDVFAVLGSPTRIVTGRPPAPVGHRNNEAYIYDQHGLYFLRQHDSNQIIELNVIFNMFPGQRFRPIAVPENLFKGSIKISQLTISPTTHADEVKSRLSDSVAEYIAGFAGGYFGKMHISYIVEPKLANQGPRRLHSFSAGLREMPKKTRNQRGRES